MQKYLQQLLPQQQTFIQQVKEAAVNMSIPIMEDTSLHLLTVLLQLQQPKRILELGTGIGYSAIKMAEAYPASEIITIEKDKARYEHALKTVADSKYHGKINIIFEDAITFLKTYDGEKFDFIYIDAAKSKYKQFFQLADQCLQHSGMIITDNVLFRGYVVNSTSIPKRYERIVDRLQHFNKWLVNHPNYSTSIVPIGDGIAVSVRLTNS